MRMDGLADVGRIRAHLDRQRDLAHQVARPGADDGAAHHAVCLGVEDELGEAFVARIGDGAAGGAPGKLRHADRGARLLRLVLGHADPGDLRVGVGDRRDDARVEMRLLPRRRLGRDMALVHRLVREHRVLRHVADGVDVRNIGSHL
jgi:hypothetical protein